MTEERQATWADVLTGWAAVAVMFGVVWTAITPDEPWWLAELRAWRRRRQNKRFGRPMCNVKQHHPSELELANLYGRRP